MRKTNRKILNRTTEILIIIVIFMAFFVPNSYALLMTQTTGDLDLRLDNGADYTWSPNLTTPSNILLATLDIKYGLWNSPDVSVDVYMNLNNVGSFIADSGYITPGPEYISFDVTGLLVDGINEVFLDASGSGDLLGDWIMGRMDLSYDSPVSVIPEPTTLILLFMSFISLVGINGIKRKV